MNRITLIVLGLLLTSSCFAVNLSMPAIFADHMVLQAGQKVPVWGITDPGASVIITFSKQKKTVKADGEGNWRVDLDQLQVSTVSQVLTITATHKGDCKELKISDVLVGEVWFAGGQSNMYRPFRMLMGKASESKYEPSAEYLRNEAATANDSLFRQYRVGRENSVFEEKTEGRGKWSKAVHGDVNEFCGTAYFFGRELRRQLNVPVAIISCNLGGTKVEPWIPMEAYENNNTLKSYYTQEIMEHKKALTAWDETKEKSKYEQDLEAWEIKVKQAYSNGEKEPAKPRKPEHPSRDKQVPATLYNAMVHPLIPYAIKGAIWYQGESNTKNLPEQYSMRLSAMIKGWRQAWGQGDFYFFYCQLANYKDSNSEPVADEDGWAVLSNQQRLALLVPNTGMAVLNDIGEAKDIHPKNKMDTGKRLSLWALKQAYGKNIVCSGPLFNSCKIKGNKVLIKFDHVGSGLMVGKKHLMDETVQVDEPLKRFQICGINGQWKWAEAKIVSKNKVEVWHPEISKPIEVRYAWSSNPAGANLYNKEGLPASIFKTQK